MSPVHRGPQQKGGYWLSTFPRSCNCVTVSFLAAETDQCPDHEGEHEDGQPAGKHEEGPSDPDHPV